MLILISLFPCLMWGKHLLLVGYDLRGGDAAILLILILWQLV